MQTDINHSAEEEYVKSISDYLSIAWRRKFLILIPFVIVLAITILTVLLLPRVYKSSGTILIESQQIPQELIQSSVSSFADERIQVIKQRILATQALLALIKKFNLYSRELKTTPRSEILADIRNRIVINLTSANVRNQRRRGASALISFTISFEHQSPVIAQKVANELVTLFLDENIKTRTARASETTEFLKKESNRLKSQIDVIEEQIATYKQENKGGLPENLTINLKRAEDIKGLLFNTERDLNKLREEKKLLSIKLDSEENGTSAIPLNSGQQTPAVELKQLQSQLISLSARYGEEHPDVKSLKRKIKAFKKEYGALDNKEELIRQLDKVKSELTVLTEKYSDEHPDVKRLNRKISSLESMLKDIEETPGQDANPKSSTFLEIQARIESTQNNIDSLEKSRINLKKQIVELDANITRSPQVERGLEALQRDLSNIKNKYQEMKAKQLQAELSMSLEEEQKGERFTLLEPPLLPDKPIKPNRPKLFVLGFALSVMSGLALAFLAESINAGIRGTAALTNAAKIPPLVTIPYITTMDDEIRKKRNIKIGLAFLVLLGIAFLIAVHTLYKPLDLIWFILLRKLNLA